MKIESSLRCLLSTALFSVSTNLMSAHVATTINDGWQFRYMTDTVSTQVHLPHSWNEDAYRTQDYKRGTGVYTKSLTIPHSMSGKRIYLKFDGAANKSEVSLDGTNVGSHTGGYSSHVIDLTPYVTPGSTHSLVVAVDNADRDIPPYSADFTFMGGLYRDAWLVSADPVHFALGNEAGLRVSTKVEPDGRCEAAISGKISNSATKKGRADLIATLYAPDGTLVASKIEKFKFEPKNQYISYNISFDKLADISLWSPESPALYSLELKLKVNGREVDEARETVGFRTFGFDDTGRFLLNGKPYKLRGMCRHQDQRPMGIALTDEQHRRDIQLIKDMGANFIRISHYPQDDAVLEMCDRLGLIAWEEIPVIDYVPESEHFANNCETMLREMIRNHYNHPSVAMWGYMNEILLRMPRENQDKTKARTLALAQRLERVLEQEDSTRMSTMAFHGSDVYHGAGLADITDVKGWNLYQGWYGGQFHGFEEFLSRQHREHPGHRIIVSEYGAGSDLRIHTLAPEAFDFSMEYQQDYLEHYLPVIEDSAFVAGASHWNFIDFSSANRAESMPHINNKGLVTNSRTKKDVYHYYRAAWHDVATDTVAHIAVRDWPERTDILDRDGVVTHPVKVYTNLPAILLKANGRTLGIKKTINCNAVYDVNLIPGYNIIEIADPSNPDRILDAAIINLRGIRSAGSRIDPSTEDFAINVGSNCYFRSDDSGLTWLPDRTYDSEGMYGHIGGKRSVSQDEIKQTADGPLLQHCITALEEYRVDVVPGYYEVELLFAELASPSAKSAYMLGRNAGSNENGWTDMDISINNQRVETSFSPGAISGAKSMVKRRYKTHVGDDGILSIRFEPARDGASTSLSAIKIRKL